MLQPRGPGAQSIADLWWLMFGLGVVIYTGVVTLAIVAAIRQRQTHFAPPDKDPAPGRSHALIVVGGVIMPTIVLIILIVATFQVIFPVEAHPDEQPVVIEVTGHVYWWEVRYPDHDVVTANEIYIPVGEPVTFRLFARDVIHSFWVPELHGKMDMIPGRVNTHYIQADEPGVYRGQCAEFCGLQHALMAFYVVAVPREEFDAWALQQRAPALEPETPLAQRGRDVFVAASCAYCHAIRGTDAETPGVGPDLTHFGSRMSIGAGTLPNTPGHLGGWIANAQASKPGNLMPPVQLSSEDLLALVEYLRGLQ